MLERNDGQSLRMHQAVQYQQGTSSRSSSGSDGSTFGRRGQPHQIRSARTTSSGVVPAFTIRSAQPGNRVQPPKRINVFAERPTPSISFRRIYQRGDLPVCIVHESRLYRLGWKVKYYCLSCNICCLPHRFSYELGHSNQRLGSKSRRHSNSCRRSSRSMSRVDLHAKSSSDRKLS